MVRNSLLTLVLLISLHVQAQLSESTVASSESSEWSLTNLLVTPPLRAPKFDEAASSAQVRQVASESTKAPQGWVATIKNKVLDWWNGENDQAQPNVEEPAPEVVSSPHIEKVREVAKSISDEAKRIKVEKAFTVSGARAADPKLEKYKSGVARFRLEKKESVKGKDGKVHEVSIAVKDIPLLDIGIEGVLNPNEFELTRYEVLDPDSYLVEKQMSPKVMTDSELKLALGGTVIELKDGKKVQLSKLNEEQKITLDGVKLVQYKVIEDAAVHELAFQELTKDELTLLKALIMVEHQDRCHVAVGFLNDVKNVGDQNTKSLVSFHLGLCLHKMGLFTEAMEHLKTVLLGPATKYKKLAIQAILKDLPFDMETEMVRTLREVPESEVEESLRDEFNYRVAKASARLEHFNNSKKFAERVRSSSNRYDEAQFVLAVSEYSLGDERGAFQRLSKLQKSFGNKKSPLADLVALNLGRMAYQQKDIKTSIDNFNKIGKDHPLWIQALIEQGWMQLLVDDSPGAIGNMYSLHSPYFSSAFKPESYVVRTIGYLNLCQFGDARNTLEFLERTHSKIYNQVKAYRKASSQSKTYSTLLSYLKNPKQREVDGLPMTVLREIGRQKDFLNLQEKINNRIDEISQYKFIEGLISKELSKAVWYKKQAQGRINELKAKIAQSAKVAEMQKNVGEWKRQISFESSVIAYNDFEVGVLTDSRDRFRKLTATGVARLSSMKTQLQAEAGQNLKQTLGEIESRLRVVLENNELLRYEILAGSGENIRFLAAGGGQKTKRVPASVNKDMNWNFEGEIWEDEIGHYRSQLVDLCPKRTARR